MRAQLGHALQGPVIGLLAIVQDAPLVQKERVIAVQQQCKPADNLRPLKWYGRRRRGEESCSSRHTQDQEDPTCHDH